MTDMGLKGTPVLDPMFWTGWLLVIVVGGLTAMGFALIGGKLRGQEHWRTRPHARMGATVR